jgi:hypothetical protein
MFCNTNGPLPGMDFGFPDVCKTPTPVGPIPLPYPNINMSVTAPPAQTRTFIMCMPAHNMMTTRPVSMGDNPGVATGLISNIVMGPGSAAMGSTNLFLGGPPATKLAMPTRQNGVSPNAVGMSISPSQIRMLVLR